MAVDPTYRDLPARANGGVVNHLDAHAAFRPMPYGGAFLPSWAKVVEKDDLYPGRLVVVIHGFPATAGGSFSLSADARQIDSAAGANGNGHHESPASPLFDEARAINDAIAYTPILATSVVLAAWRGREARALALIAAAIEDSTAEDERRATALAEYARAVLYNGLGRYQQALDAAERACVHGDLGSFGWALPELVEAGARSNAREVASDALDHLENWALAAGTDPALGLRARSAALLSEGDRAEGFYHEAIEHLGRSRTEAQLARAQLVYGEWLRRENRRVDARVHLRAAHDTFRRIAAEAFAERASRELLATGETARKRTDDARANLTPQEAQIARLARDGLTNPEIGAQLFISPRTVQYHLRKVFLKLDITSRRQLGRISAGRLGMHEPLHSVDDLPEPVGTRARTRLATSASASADASASSRRNPRAMRNASMRIQEERLP